MNTKRKILFFSGVGLVVAGLVSNIETGASWYDNIKARLYILLRYLEEGNKPALKAYNDGGGIWTIGYGSTYNWDEKRKVKQGDTITPETAERWLEYEASSKLNDVSKSLYVTQTANQLLALASFAYNEGTTALKNSKLLKIINNNGTPGQIKNEFGKWVYSNDSTGKKVFNQGLKNRRDAEIKIYFS